MSIFDTLIAIMAIHNCLGCSAEGRLLCDRCAQSLLPPVPRCYRCQKRSVGGHTCSGCQSVSPLKRVQPAVAYHGYARDILWSLKSGGAQAAAREMIQLALATIEITLDPAPCYIVPLPTASSRARQRGYDQAQLLARQLSHQTRRAYRNCLIRRGQAHQVGASRQQRLQQIAGAFRVKTGANLQGAHIILIDDVLTTGASLETAAQVLHQAGAGHIEAITFAQA